MTTKKKPKEAPAAKDKYTVTAAEMRLAVAGWWKNTIIGMEQLKTFISIGELSRDLDAKERETAINEIDDVIRGMSLFGGGGFLVRNMSFDELAEKWGGSLRPGDGR
jgi:hypothetical protein